MSVWIRLHVQVWQMQTIPRSQTLFFAEVKDCDGTDALESHVESSVSPLIHDRVHNELVLRTLAETPGLKGKDHIFPLISLTKLTFLTTLLLQ